MTRNLSKREYKLNSNKTEIVSTEIFSGPLPAPVVLEAYERVIKGSSARILKMAESELLHRHRREMIYDDRQDRAMHFSLFITVLLIVGGFVLTAFDKSVVGILAIFSPAVFQFGKFIFSRISKDS